MSNVGNIVLEQDPRQQDPFYRNFYARAEGMPLAAVNSVVHNVKHQSEGQFKLWHELPSHKVRPGYSTTTKAPKIKTTTVPWVRGRHRPQLGLQQVPWHQKFSDPDGYDTGQHGSDYDEGAPAPRQRGRRPTGGRGRRPPPPMAPVRVQVGKEDGLVDNGEGEGLDLATLDEGTRAGDSEGTKNTEGEKVTTTEKATTTKAAPKTTKKPEKKTEKEKKKEENTDDEDSEGTKTTDGNEAEEGEGEKHGEIDLADLKKGGVIHHLRTSGKGKTVGDGENEEEEGEEDGEPKKKDKKKGKKKEEDEEEQDEKSKKSKSKEKGKKKSKKGEDDNEKESKNKKKGGRKSKKEDQDEDEEDDDDKNGELKKVDGDVKIPKAVDGDTDGHDDDDEEEEEDDDEEEEEEDEEEGKSKRKRNHKKTKKGKKHHDEEEEEEYEEDDDDAEDNEEEDAEEEQEHHQKQKKMKKNKPSCPPAPQRHQNQPQHNPTHQNILHHLNQNIPPNQVPYPNPDAYGYTHPTAPTTTTTQYSRERLGDDYHEFETMDCKENSQDDEENEEEDDQSEEHKKKKKKKKSKKNHKKKGKKKSKKGGTKGHASLDYLTSREKIDQNKRNRGHILDELHADKDLKKIRKNSKPPESGVDCSTAVDEFPLKCGAWKSAGFCDTNQATQFLWCRKTCLCSTTITSTTSSTNT